MTTATPGTIKTRPLTVAPRSQKLHEVVPGVFTNASVGHLMQDQIEPEWNPIEGKYEL